VLSYYNIGCVIVKCWILSTKKNPSKGSLFKFTLYGFGKPWFARVNIVTLNQFVS